MQITSIAVENFKALRSSGTIRLKPLNVIIGNNGSGKSSLLEAAETYVRILDLGVEGAMKHWQGFEHIWHKGAQAGKASSAPLSKQPNPMKLTLNLKLDKVNAKVSVAVNTADKGNLLFIQQEHGQIASTKFERNVVGKNVNSSFSGLKYSDDLKANIEGASRSIGGANTLLPFLGAFDKVTRSLRNTLFLRLNPDAIGQLQSVSRSGQRIRLASDGSNVAEYLIDLRERSPSAFEQITHALRYVLPYASDVEPKVLDAGIIRRSYVQLLESKYEIPGWLMSSGSLRVLPLIATLLDPDPPPVVFIEEVENGLDPRTVGLVVDLMRSAAQSGRSQIIATTHSPYLLDMLDLDDVLLCERGEKGPEFSWPGSRAEMQAWRQSFMPGRLYTMNALQRDPSPSAGAPAATDGEAPAGGWGDGE
ncbi:ATP-binding protein [Rhodoferax sp.]|uniref:AAA family ATPase n=1 Tax=Rhodoferax sp. TaxID=50421 RepID=UPI00261CE360|nr:ATP-binding protein [Rhodoferax sp.]MDD5478945.1 AAA family ATPase [Rhodoferax sp.]